MRAHLALFIALAMTGLCFSGCGGNRGPERVVVSGTVTYNGKLIPTGLIRLSPLETSSTSMSGAVVTDGKYRADARGGVPVGTYKVRIEANRAVAQGSASQPGGTVPMPGQGGLQQYIPKKYNAETQLEITIPSGSREITKNFDLTD